MTQIEDSKIIGIMHPICCGLDIHKETISACVIFRAKMVWINMTSRSSGHLRMI